MTPYPVALTSHDLAAALRAMLAHRFNAFKSTVVSMYYSNDPFAGMSGEVLLWLAAVPPSSPLNEWTSFDEAPVAIKIELSNKAWSSDETGRRLLRLPSYRLGYKPTRAEALAVDVPVDRVDLDVVFHQRFGAQAQPRKKGPKRGETVRIVDVLERVEQVLVDALTNEPKKKAKR